MRKGPGLSALSRHSAYSNSYSTLSTTISSSQLTSLQESLESFRDTLLEFSIKHRHDIRKDPAFRHQFQKMCAALGIDPLAASASASGSGSGSGSSKNGFWGMIGMSEWEYELSVQLVDICVSTRSKNGGMISINELITKIEYLRSGGKAKKKSISNDEVIVGGVTDEDIIRSIEILEPLCKYTIHKIGSTKYIRTIPKSLDVDQSVLLAIAASNKGKLISNEHIKVRTGWSSDRIILVLEDSVMREGLGWVDGQSPSDSEMNIWNTDGGRGNIWIIAATDFEDVFE
ncbi:uncharacterized protein IL334_005983 [Kwoniella shivajii]|uniref:Uncharacterized protein n=1 Tax=Kwoniella shivajii TaxID=564305 RepID=A0ABZ1D583_9TREE|nr:hypothetical protein IL334_005983 [Kwoniella shivajii]